MINLNNSCFKFDSLREVSYRFLNYIKVIQIFEFNWLLAAGIQGLHRKDSWYFSHIWLLSFG